MSAAVALDAATETPWDAGRPPPVHPAAALFPSVVDGPEFEALVDDIHTHGQRRPIVRAIKGAILDGRRRLLACQLLGIAPKYSVHTGDPWRYVININAHRFTGNNHRCLVGGAILNRHGNHLSGRQVVELCGASSVNSVGRGKAIAATGIDRLKALTVAGQVPLTTGARIAGLPPEAQETFCDRIERGALPRHVGRPGWTGDETPADITHLSQREARYRYVQEPALRTIAHSLDGLAIVLKTADGLDPAITPEQAAHWRSDLSRQHKTFRRLMALLKDRAAQGA